MIDLTPLEVRKKKGDFKRAMRGYDTALVDDFLEIVADRLDELVRANLAHEDHVRQLEQQLRDYKERERALTDALVSAQELREEMREQAVRDAETARREAEQEAEQIRANVTQAIEREEQTLRRLRARQAQLAQNYRALLEREMEELDVIAGGVTYRAGLDEAVETPHRDETARRSEPARADEPPLREPPPREPSRREPRAGGPQAVREPHAAYGAAAPSAGPAGEVTDDRTGGPRAAPAPAGAAAVDDEGEDVDDATLERSLEALQVVFARDGTEIRRDWPLPTGTRGGPTAPLESRSGATAPVPAPAAAPEAAAATPSQPAPSSVVPVVRAEDSMYGEELLLEDAIDEGEAGADTGSPAAAVDPWLPTLIEEAP